MKTGQNGHLGAGRGETDISTHMPGQGVLPIGTYPHTVAIVLDDNGAVYDECFTWETGQNYALSEGMRVIAIADDGYMTQAKAQALYDAELARFMDCFNWPQPATYPYREGKG